MTSSQNLLLPIQQVFSDLGIVGSGYKVYTYQTQTVSTPLTTYSNTGLSIANPNPLVTLTNGRFANQAWVANKNLVKLVITDPNDVVIQTIDPVDNFSNNNLNTFNPIPAVYIGTTAGTNTAYTITSLIDISQVGYNSDDVFIITFDQACGASPTLAIDGLSALPLVKYTGQGATTPLIAGDVQNQRYFITISGSNIIVLNPRGNPLFLGDNGTQTISSGLITVTGSNTLVDTEAAAATDDLDTVQGTAKGEVIVLGVANGSHLPTFKHNTGNLKLQDSIDFITTAATDKLVLLNYDGTNLVELARSGQGTLGPQLLQTKTASTSATLDFINIPTSQYKQFQLRISGLVVATNTTNLLLRVSVDNGSTFLATNVYNYNNVYSGTAGLNIDAVAGTSSIIMTTAVGGIASTGSLNGTITLSSLSSTTLTKQVLYDIVLDSVSSDTARIDGSGAFVTTATAVNALRLLAASGNLVSGTVELWGIR